MLIVKIDAATIKGNYTLILYKNNLQEHEPEIWWKIKNKLRTKPSLKHCRKMYFGKRCRSFPLTNGYESPFLVRRRRIAILGTFSLIFAKILLLAKLDTVLTLSIYNCL